MRRVYSNPGVHSNRAGTNHVSLTRKVERTYDDASFGSTIIVDQCLVFIVVALSPCMN